MSGTSKNFRLTTPHDSDQRETTVQLNNVIAAMDALLAKLDLDAGVTDTTYASLIGTGYAAVKNAAGNLPTNP